MKSAIKLRAPSDYSNYEDITISIGSPFHSFTFACKESAELFLKNVDFKETKSHVYASFPAEYREKAKEL